MFYKSSLASLWKMDQKWKKNKNRGRKLQKQKIVVIGTRIGRMAGIWEGIWEAGDLDK